MTESAIALDGCVCVVGVGGGVLPVEVKAGTESTVALDEWGFLPVVEVERAIEWSRIRWGICVRATNTLETLSPTAVAANSHSQCLFEVGQNVLYRFISTGLTRSRRAEHAQYALQRALGYSATNVH